MRRSETFAIEEISIFSVSGKTNLRGPRAFCTGATKDPGVGEKLFNDSRMS